MVVKPVNALWYVAKACARHPDGVAVYWVGQQAELFRCVVHVFVHDVYVYEYPNAMHPMAKTIDDFAKTKLHGIICIIGAILLSHSAQAEDPALRLTDRDWSDR